MELLAEKIQKSVKNALGSAATGADFPLESLLKDSRGDWRFGKFDAADIVYPAGGMQWMEIRRAK